MVLMPPIAFLAALAGLAADRPKTYALVALVISGFTCCLWLLPNL